MTAAAADRAVREAFGQQVATDDGDWVLPRSAAAIRARWDGDRRCLRIWAVAVADAPNQPGLAADLSDLDARSPLARVVRPEGTAAVVVEGEVPADRLSPQVVSAVRAEVDAVAAEAGATLAARWGGIAGADLAGGLGWVWRRWAQAVLSVEAAPGCWVDLTGPAAVAELPLPEPIHLLTAWDPGGTPATPDANEAATARLRTDLAGLGATVAASAGRDPDGSYADAGCAVSGLDLRTARDLGARYGQEAIYEVTGSSVAVVACRSDRVVTVQRRAADGAPAG